jgi:hypothetical protein
MASCAIASSTLERLGAATATKRDLARGPRVSHPSGRPVPGNQPSVARDLKDVDGRRIEASGPSARHREDVAVGRAEAEPRHQSEHRFDHPSTDVEPTCLSHRPQSEAARP